MKLYRTFGSLHYKGGCYAPFISSKWTTKKEDAENYFNTVTLKDFREADAEALNAAKMDAIPGEKTNETYFLWIELVEVEISGKTIPPDDEVLEVADYNQTELKERGIWLNGKKMKQEDLKTILDYTPKAATA